MISLVGQTCNFVLLLLLKCLLNIQVHQWLRAISWQPASKADTWSEGLFQKPQAIEMHEA